MNTNKNINNTNTLHFFTFEVDLVHPVYPPYKGIFHIQAENYKRAEDYLKDIYKKSNWSIRNFCNKEEVLIDITKDNKASKEPILKVVCTTPNFMFPNFGDVDETYYLRLSTVYIDCDGVTYGRMYKDKELTQELGNVCLSRFCSIETIY